MKKALYLITLIFLTSCTNTQEALKNGVKQDSSSLRARIADSIYPEGRLLTPSVTSHAYSYCYKSWADSSCYKEPVKGQEYLLIDGK